jgi:hypothetical protein
MFVRPFAFTVLERDFNVNQSVKMAATNLLLLFRRLLTVLLFILLLSAAFLERDFFSPFWPLLQRNLAIPFIAALYSLLLEVSGVNRPYLLMFSYLYFVVI